MKKALYGTVSTLALLLATHGVASAQATLNTFADGSTASGVSVDAGNLVENFAFQQFKGALQVQQNASVDGGASQNMAVAVLSLSAESFGVESPANSNSNFSFGNSATNGFLFANNFVGGQAFLDAKGAVQVQQNDSLNSTAGQNVDIDAVSIAKAGGVTVGAIAPASLSPSNESDFNKLTNSAAVGFNSLQDQAFQNAGGAFQVQQNTSFNGTTQQNMSVSAFSAQGAIPTFSSSAATLEGAANGNSATGSSVCCDNGIITQAFMNARGAFQVQQNNGANSSLGQNMAIAAIDASNSGGGGGGGNADTASSSQSVAGNTASGVETDNFNFINTAAFENATGAFQVQQNASINSSVSQNMAVNAVSEGNNVPFTAIGTSATSTSSVENNTATDAIVSAGEQFIVNNAFENARGAFQVQQNNSVNSAAGQNMDINAFAAPGGTVSSQINSKASLTNDVGSKQGNVLKDTTGHVNSVFGVNFIADSAFLSAAGAFQVQENASINSSAQQNMSIAAVTGHTVGSLGTDTEASLTDTEANSTINFPVSITISGINETAGAPFNNAHGAFQVQQSSSADSAVGQNMAIVAVDAGGAGKGAGGPGAPNSASLTSTASNNTYAAASQNTGEIDTENFIAGLSFGHARGAFQVQQNGSVASAVSQNMAVTAVTENGSATDATVASTATNTNTVANNFLETSIAINTSLVDNTIRDQSFGNATGAFQVQQNRSYLSSTGQNMAIRALADDAGSVKSNGSSTAKLTSTVGSQFWDAILHGNNEVLVQSFDNAAGAFQVQQNSSYQSSNQQNMSIVAVKAMGALVSSLGTTSEADLTHNLTGNQAYGFNNDAFPFGRVLGENLITDSAFANAKGAFQVQQSESTTSAVGQNMAIVAVTADGGGGGTTASAATANFTATVKGSRAGDFFGSSFPVHVNTENGIDSFAFENAQGAFQVQQNGSINSSVGQNMAISAAALQGVTSTGTTATATTNITISGNFARNSSVETAGGGASDNLINGESFANAGGAIQVPQNRSINSSTGQNMAIAALTDPGATVTNQNAPATLLTDAAFVGNNTVNGGHVQAVNTITDQAFMNAKGAFQVQQNNSINSATQQNMAIAAVSAKGGFDQNSPEAFDELANLESVVTGNTVNGAFVSASHVIGGNAFQNARGAIQVQQSSSINGAVSQNMSIVAVSTRH